MIKIKLKVCVLILFAGAAISCLNGHKYDLIDQFDIPGKAYDLKKIRNLPTFL